MMTSPHSTCGLCCAGSVSYRVPNISNCTQPSAEQTREMTVVNIVIANVISVSRRRVEGEDEATCLC